MKKWITILSGILVLQLILIITINLSGDDYSAFQAEEKLLSFDINTVNQLHINDGTDSVVLEKRDGNWLLPETWDYPANKTALAKLLDTFSVLSKGWPVATSASAADRFKVAENDFERKVSFLIDEQTQATLYIGTSPGFRKVHVRLDKEDNIFNVALESWEASAQTDYWLKKDILALDAADIDQLTLADFVLNRSNLTLEPSNLSDHESPDSDAISRLINNLTGLQIQSVNGVKEDKDYQLDNPSLEINLTLKNGDKLNYKFSKPKEENSHYFLKRSDLPYYFTVADVSVKTLEEVERSQLVQERNEDEDE